jgi:Mlc titration factor MtfA (ptsG expression regulator)
MSRADVALALLVLLAAAFITWVLSQPARLRRRRARLRSRPFPAEWSAILQRRMPVFGRLPPELRRQLEGHVLVFLAEKEFVGCNGLEITDEMRVLIAAQACLLILNRRADYYFPDLTQVLVYPTAFVVEREEYDEAGVRSRERQVLVGESWTDSQVILSWEDVLEGAAVDDDGWNVVLHEFAHQLDQAKGYASGAPELPGRERYAAWSEVFTAEFERLRERGEDPESLLDEYGATDPAEFFAVVTEVFFEQPRDMRAEHPALYRELARYYRVDPASWHRSPDPAPVDPGSA